MFAISLRRSEEMDPTERARLLEQIATVLGDDAYNQLVGSIAQVRERKRLRFWQEELLGRAGISVSTVTEFVDLFESASWRVTGQERQRAAERLGLDGPIGIDFFPPYVFDENPEHHAFREMWYASHLLAMNEGPLYPSTSEQLDVD